MPTAKEVATWLGAESIDILSGGEWSQAFGTSDRVVRFGRHREDFLKDQLLAHYAGPRLPIPKVFEIGRAFDLDYCISERKFGRMTRHTKIGNFILSFAFEFAASRSRYQ